MNSQFAPVRRRAAVNRAVRRPGGARLDDVIVDGPNIERI